MGSGIGAVIQTRKNEDDFQADPINIHFQKMAASTHTMPTVAEFYRGRDIFLTGGTGFIGKVFIEKLLRSCPEMGDIYMLVRPRRNQTVHDRLKKMFKEKVGMPCALQW